MKRLLFVILSACAQTPSGGFQLSLISEKEEIALGDSAAREIAEKMPLIADRQLTAYVERVGLALAKHSTRPLLPWRFAIIDDEMVNAFALPGGPVFVTRGMLTHLGSEAELAMVLGHEIGHVAARHGAHRLSQELLLKKSFGWGSLVLPAAWARAIGDVAGAGAQIVFLKYGRDDERQADALGVDYVSAGGFDAQRGVFVFHTLDRVNPKNGSEMEWLQTHPSSDQRFETARALAPSGGVSREAEYVQALAGVVFGEDPRRGTFVGDRYLNPRFGFSIALPRGWQKAKKGDVVAAVNPEGDALVQVSFAEGASVEEAARAFLKDFTKTREEGRRIHFVGEGVSGMVTFLPVDGKIVEVVATAKQTGYAQRARAFDATFRSLVRIDPNTRVSPARVVPVELPRAMTTEEFLKAFPSVTDVRVANGLTDGQLIPAGRWLKRVVQ